MHSLEPVSQNQLSPVDKRLPVIDRKDAFDINSINAAWLLFTEVIRRELITDPALRPVLSRFATTEVSEALPDALLKTLAQSNQRIAKLTHRYRESLGKYLALPTVPAELITPDLTNARAISHAEKTLAAQRFVFARDVKLLALEAEVLITPSLDFNKNNEAMLPSGIKIKLNVEDENIKTDFITPHLWEKRRQVKDRVYEIHVNGRKYFLKEKKPIGTFTLSNMVILTVYPLKQNLRWLNSFTQRVVLKMMTIK